MSTTAGGASDSSEAAGGAASSADCMFCRIVAGDAPASVVHADDEVIAFLDTVPVNTGHVLVVPREHVVGLVDLPVAVGEALWRAAHRIAAVVRADPSLSEGVNLHLSDGEAAGQSVGHVHLHVIPRWTDDGLRIVEDNVPLRPSRDELDQVAVRLEQALSDAPEQAATQAGDEAH